MAGPQQIIRIALMISFMQVVVSILCDKYCDVCNESLSVCKECIQGFHIDASTQRCQSNCLYGQYYHPITQQCLSICPSQYYNDDDSFSCRFVQSCPFLSEQGMQFFEEFTQSVLHEGFLVTSGKNSLKDDFTLKIFNATSGKYLGYMEGHDSEILTISVLPSSQKLVSISSNQMISWNLFYGQQESIVSFGKIDYNSLSPSQQAQIMQGKTAIYLYNIEKGNQPLYFDEDIIILWINLKQFGILYHKQLRANPKYRNNMNLFNSYFKQYDTVHTSLIRGFFKPKGNLFYSFSDKIIISWDMSNNATISGSQGCCTFKKETINQIMQVGEKLFLIQFLNIMTFSVLDVNLGKCFYVDQKSFPPNNEIKLVEEIISYDINLSTILIRTKKFVFIYQVLSSLIPDPQNPSYSFKQLKMFNQPNIFVSFNPKPFLFLLDPSGVLKINKIDFQINDQTMPAEINVNSIQLGVSDFAFTQQMYISDIHFIPEESTCILVGKQLLTSRFNKHEELSLEEPEIISALKNIQPQQRGHRGQINGILIDITNKYRVITYSSDGSFKIWELYDDVSEYDFASSAQQGGFLDRARLVMEQYHPFCNIIESSNCSWGVVMLEQIETTIIIAQYSDNSITMWEYSPYQILYIQTYSLYDQNQKINNYHYHFDLKMLVINNESQLAIFDNQDVVIYNEYDTFLRAYFFKGDAKYNYNHALVLFYARGLKFEVFIYYYNPIQNSFSGVIRKRTYKNSFVYCEIFSNNLIFFSTINNLFYLINMPEDLNQSLKSMVSYFKHDPVTTKTFILFKNGMVSIGTVMKTFVSKNYTNTDAPLRSITIAHDPLIFFFYQNYVYYPNNNQVIGINQSVDIVFYMVFQDPISSISVDSINQKLYVGFQNGKIYHGPYISQQLNQIENIPNPTNVTYTPSLKSLFMNKKTTVLRKDLFTNTNSEFNTNKMHKQPIDGYVLDEVNNFIITYSKENKSCLFKWQINNPLTFQKVSDDTMTGTASAFLDVKGDYLMSFTSNWVDTTNYNYDVIVWKYSTLQKVYTNQYHKKLFDDQQAGELPENQILMTYFIKQIFILPSNQTLISINNYFQVSIYQYTKNKSDSVFINNIEKLFYDDLNNIFYAKIINPLNQTLDIYDINFIFITRKQEHKNDVRDLFFIQDRAISYDVQTVCIMNRKDFKTIIKFSSDNPKVSNLIISLKLNLAIIWNNYLTDDIINQKIGIFDIRSGKSIFEISPIQMMETGNINLAYLEESTCQLYFSRSSGYIYSFDVCQLRNTGIYTVNLVGLTDLIFIPEFNQLVSINPAQTWQIKQLSSKNLRLSIINSQKQSISYLHFIYLIIIKSVTRVEYSVSPNQKFSSLYASNNNNYFVNKKEDATYYIDFDNSVWRLNNQSFKFDYITQLDRIVFAKFHQHKYYVATSYALFQYDDSFYLNLHVQEIVQNIYFSNDFLFLQVGDFTLKKLNKLDFSFSQSFAVQLNDYVKHVFIIEDLSEIMIYEKSSKLSRYNYRTDKLLYTQSLSQFAYSFISNDLNMIIHIQTNSDIIFYQSITPDMTSLLSAQQYKFSQANLQSLKTIKTILDAQNNNIIAAYSDNMIRVFKMVMTGKNIQSISQVKIMPSPTVTNLLKLKIRANYLQLYLPWQVIEYDRTSLQLANNFNNSQIISNMKQYYLNKEVPKFMFVSSSDSLSMVNVPTQKIIFKFPLSYPSLISSVIQTFTFQYSVQIIGVSNGVFFKYNFFIPISDDIVKSEQSFRECYFDVGFIERFYNQYNQINILKTSLNQLSIQIDRTLLQISPVLSVYYQVAMDTYNSKVLYKGTDDNNQQRRIQFVVDTFLPEKFKEVQLRNYQVDITDCEFMSFNKRTKRVVFQDINFVGNGKNTVLDFSDMNYVILENIKVDTLVLSEKSVLFRFTNCQSILIKNISFNGITLNDLSKLFIFSNVQDILIQDLILDQLSIHSSDTLSTIIQVQNVKKGRILNSILTNISYFTKYELKNFIFDLQGNTGFTIYNCTYANSTSISLLSSKNSYENGFKIYFKVHDVVLLDTIIVDNINALYESLIKSTGYQLSIVSSHFANITCLLCTGGTANFLAIKKLLIDNSNFSNSHSTKGGCIGIIEGRFNQTVIQNSNFTNNIAESSGGALYLEFSDLQMKGNLIENNRALIGGGIRYIGIQPSFVTDILKNPSMKKNNLFQNNVAAIHSQNYGSYVFAGKMESNVKLKEIELQKTESFESGNSVDKSKLKIKEYEIEDFQSGGTIDLHFKIVDTEDYTINFDIDLIKKNKYPIDIIEEIMQFQVKAVIDNDEIKIYGMYITNYQLFDQLDKSFTIKEMQVVSMPQIQNYIYFEIPAIKRVVDNSYFYDGPFYIKLIINFRKCEVGELYMPSSSLFLCGECKVGFYSLIEPSKEQASVQSCQRCPAEAEHCHRDQISLKNGYWRISNDTDRIQKCVNKPTNCVGDESKGYCLKGHFGPLCEQCDIKGEIWGEKYMTDGKYNCVNCGELQTNFKYMLPSIIVGICMVIYMIISVRIALEISEQIVIGYYLRKMNLISISKSAFLDTTNMNMKAMMNYMQIAQLVNTFEVELPSFLKILPEYIGEPVNNFMYTLDCYLNELANESVPVIYLRTIWSLTMPFLYLIGMGIVYFILVTCKFTKHSRSYIISGLVFMIFFLQPSTISHLLKVMSCRQIDKLKYVLADTTQSCYTQTHVLYIFYICIPGLILWAFFIPVFILKQLYTNRNSLDNALIRIPYGFLYQDYKYDMYYWEFIKSYLKILIVIIHNFYGDPYNNKLVLTIILLLLYQVALLRFKPYQMRYFQNLEKRSMEILVVIVTMNIFLYNKPDFIQQQIFYIIVLGIHNIYQLYLIWEVLKAKVTILYSQNKEIVKQKIKKFFPRFAKWIDSSKQKNMKTFYYWKRIKKEITYAKEKKIRMIKRQKAKIFFDEDIEKQREKIQNIPITSSQLSMIADNASSKYLIENNSHDHYEMASQRSLIRDVSGIMSPNNEGFNSFLIKSPSQRLDQIISSRDQDDRSASNSIFIDMHQKSFRFNNEDDKNNSRQFDRLFEALSQQKKWEDQQKKVDEQGKQYYRERIQNKGSTLIYRNLRSVPTFLKISDPTQASESEIEKSDQKSGNKNKEQAVKNVEDYDSMNIDYDMQSIESPYKQTLNLNPKQQLFHFDSTSKLGDITMNEQVNDTPVKSDHFSKQNQSNDCNIVDSRDSDQGNNSNIFFPRGYSMQESESLRPNQLFDKLRKQVTSEYLNDQTIQFTGNNKYQSSRTIGFENSEIQSTNNFQFSKNVAQYQHTDSDSIFEKGEIHSSKIEDGSSDVNRVIINMDQQSQKILDDNSIAYSSMGQMSQITNDKPSLYQQNTFIFTQRQKQTSDIQEFKTIQSQNTPFDEDIQVMNLKYQDYTEQILHQNQAQKNYYAQEEQQQQQQLNEQENSKYIEEEQDALPSIKDTNIEQIQKQSQYLQNISNNQGEQEQDKNNIQKINSNQELDDDINNNNNNNLFLKQIVYSNAEQEIIESLESQNILS